MDRTIVNSPETFTYHNLSNGLRIVHLRHPSDVEYCGVAVRVGSRDERPGEEGLAHFVEHTIFKGTNRRRSWHIINRMEAVGGELNAYTTKEETTIYSAFPIGNLDRAAELIADLTIGSVFPQAQIDKEREVVAEEIDSYLDSPAEAVFDDFEDLIFSGTPLGHNILGNRHALATFDSAKCREFLHRFYVAGNMVFFYAGPAAPDRVFRVVEKHFTPLPDAEINRHDTPLPNQPPFRNRRDDQDNHQAHNIIGARVCSIHSPARHSVALLNNIIGGPGMNSRFNIILREKRGLVYTVDSSTSIMTDAGLLTIYFGCNPDDIDRCVNLIFSELRKLAENPLTDRVLQAAKRQYIGQMIVSAASIEQLILSAARATLLLGNARTISQTAAAINNLTPADIQTAAQTLHPTRCSLLTLS